MILHQFHAAGPGLASHSLPGLSPRPANGAELETFSTGRHAELSAGLVMASCPTRTKFVPRHVFGVERE